MKTSYFAKLNKEDIPGAVCIAVGRPKNKPGIPVYKKLAPSWDLLKRFNSYQIDEAQYLKEYRAQLSRLDPRRVKDELDNMVWPNVPVVMCHCATKHFCHRHIFAEWIEKELGVTVVEYGDEKTDRKDGYIIKVPVKEFKQGELF